MFTAFPALDLLEAARDLEAPVWSARASPLRFPRGMRGEARFPRGKRGKTRVRGAGKVRFPRGIRNVSICFVSNHPRGCKPAIPRGKRVFEAFPARDTRGECAAVAAVYQPGSGRAGRRSAPQRPCTGRAAAPQRPRRLAQRPCSGRAAATGPVVLLGFICDDL